MRVARLFEPTSGLIPTGGIGWAARSQILRIPREDSADTAGWSAFAGLRVNQSTNPQLIRNRSKPAMKKILLILFLVCNLSLVCSPLIAQDAKVTSLMSKPLPDTPGKELLMIMVEYPPGGAVASCVGIRCDAFSGIESTLSGSEVNWLIDRLCCQRVPTIDLAHVDLTGGEQRPEQHRRRVCRRQHGLRFDPPLELFM
jgi:hypothetical protein